MNRLLWLSFLILGTATVSTSEAQVDPAGEGDWNDPVTPIIPTEPGDRQGTAPTSSGPIDDVLFEEGVPPGNNLFDSTYVKLILGREVRPTDRLDVIVQNQVDTDHVWSRTETPRFRLGDQLFSIAIWTVPAENLRTEEFRVYLHTPHLDPAQDPNRVLLIHSHRDVPSIADGFRGGFWRFDLSGVVDNTTHPNDVRLSLVVYDPDDQNTAVALSYQDIEGRVGLATSMEPAPGPLSLTAWPNPARWGVRLDGVEPETRWTAHDALGRRVAEGTGGQIDVSGWRPGMYVVRAVSQSAAARSVAVTVVR